MTHNFTASEFTLTVIDTRNFEVTRKVENSLDRRIKSFKMVDGAPVVKYANRETVSGIGRTATCLAEVGISLHSQPEIFKPYKMVFSDGSEIALPN